MTTRDYELLADVIRPRYDAAVERFNNSIDLDDADYYGSGRDAIEDLVKDLCERPKAENPRFHEATFTQRALGKLPSELNPGH